MSFYFFLFIYELNMVLQKHKEYAMMIRIMVKNENEFLLLPRVVKEYFKKMRNIDYPSIIIFNLTEDKDSVEFGWVVEEHMITKDSREPMSIFNYIEGIIDEKIR